MPTEKPRMSITVPQELLDRIEDFRYENRISSQTKAIITLIGLGLDTLDTKPYKPSEPPLKPSDARLLATFHAA